MEATVIGQDTCTQRQAGKELVRWSFTSGLELEPDPKTEKATETGADVEPGRAAKPKREFKAEPDREAKP